MSAMEAKIANAKARSTNGKEKRPYGKAPLELGLDLAINAVNRIAQEGKSLPVSALAVILGNTMTSSSFTRKVRALTSYGLLAEQPDGQYALTELALAIALPRSAQAQAEATKHAFLKIAQFNLLFNQHKGKLLPAEEFLRNVLEQESGIPRETSQVWAQQFKDGARSARLLYRRSDGKIQITESPVSDDSDAAPLGSEPNAKADSAQSAADDVVQSVATETPRAVALPPAQFQQATISGHHTRIELSDGRTAEIIIPDNLTSKDAKKLKRALEGVAVIIESMMSEEG